MGEELLLFRCQRELPGLGEEGRGSEGEAPWVCDDRERWVTKRSLRGAEKEETQEILTWAWRWAGWAGRSLLAHSLGTGSGPITAAPRGPAGGGQGSSQEQLEGEQLCLFLASLRPRFQRNVKCC